MATLKEDCTLVKQLYDRNYLRMQKARENEETGILSKCRRIEKLLREINIAQKKIKGEIADANII